MSDDLNAQLAPQDVAAAVAAAADPTPAEPPVTPYPMPEAEAHPITYTAPHDVYQGGVMYKPGVPFTVPSTVVAGKFWVEEGATTVELPSEPAEVIAATDTKPQRRAK